MSLKAHLTPTLDGQPLQHGDEGVVHLDGRALTADEAQRVVYIARDDDAPWFDGLPSLPSRLAFDSDDSDVVDDGVAALLAGVSSDDVKPHVDLDAGFFHLSLLHWLGLVDDDAAASARWSYDFWRADIHPVVDADDAVPDGAEVYEAVVFSGDAAAGGRPRTHRYFVVHEEGAIADAGWLSTPPDLLHDDDSSSAFSVLPEPSADVINDALFDDDAEPASDAR